MGKYLTREQILAAPDIRTEEVPVPEWGGTVLVRGMSGAERDDYEEALMVRRGKNREVNLKNARAKLLVRCLVDENGKRVFDESDIRALSARNAAALERVVDVASKLSGIREEDMEELTKNSESDQGDDSASA